MAQTSLTEKLFVNNAKAKSRHPDTAETIEEYQHLYKMRYDRLPTGPEMLDYYEAHPEQYEDRFGETIETYHRRSRRFDK
jgi:hypothetical protein